MNIERIFQNYNPKPIGMEKEYSVIILIAKINGKDHIIFEKEVEKFHSQERFHYLEVKLR